VRDDNDADPSADDTTTHTGLANEAACVEKFKEDLLSNVAYEFAADGTCKIFSGIKKLKAAAGANTCKIASFAVDAYLAKKKANKEAKAAIKSALEAFQTAKDKFDADNDAEEEKRQAAIKKTKDADREAAKKDYDAAKELLTEIEGEMNHWQDVKKKSIKDVDWNRADMNFKDA